MDDPTRCQRDLIAKLAKYEHEVREKLKARYGGRLRGEVDDVIQEAYMRMFKAELAHVRCPQDYLYTVAKNVANDCLQSRHRKLTEYVAKLQETWMGATPATEATVIAESMMIEAIHNLPRQCRRVLVLCRLRSFSIQEAARRMGISVRTVKKHLTTAHDRLKAAVTSEAGPRRRAAGGRSRRE